MPRPHSALGLGLVLCAPLLAACRPKMAFTPETGARKSEAPPIQPCTVEQREMVDVLEVTSRLESEREVEVFTELAGRAVEVLVEEGDRVRAGDLLARLDARDELLALRDAEVALREAKDGLTMTELAVEEVTQEVENLARKTEQAQRDYERDLQLYQTEGLVNPLSKQALEAKQLEFANASHLEAQSKIMLRRKGLERDGAETAIARAEVALERARLNLQKKNIVAPFDGVISLRNIRVGDSVGAAEPAFVLTDTSTLRAVFSRPQEELDLFSAAGTAAPRVAGEGRGGASGLTITATAEAYPGRTFQGWVERISPTIDAASGQFRVLARLRAADAEGATDVELLPGMLVRMRIVTDRHPDSLVIPKRALRRQGEVRYVLRLVGEEGAEADVLTLERVEVAEGFEDDSYLEIVPREPGSLVAGDRLVLVGGRDLKEGAQVRLSEPLSAEGAGDDEAQEPQAAAELTSTGEAGGDGSTR